MRLLRISQVLQWDTLLVYETVRPLRLPPLHHPSPVDPLGSRIHCPDTLLLGCCLWELSAEAASSGCLLVYAEVFAV